MRDGELTDLDSAQLTERLKRELESVGGLAMDRERHLARELVRRARREEQLRDLLRELLTAGEALAKDASAQPAWDAVASRASKLLPPS